MLSTIEFFQQDVVEYLSKISNTVINMLGIISLIIGLAEIQQLNYRDPDNASLHLEMDLVRADKAFMLFFAPYWHRSHGDALHETDISAINTTSGGPVYDSVHLPLSSIATSNQASSNRSFQAVSYLITVEGH